MKKKIFVYCDTEWSLGRVNRNVQKWLRYKYDFTFCDWAHKGIHFLLEVMNEYDIILTNLCNLRYLLQCAGNNICLKKFIFVSHGYPEMQEIYTIDTIYTATSKSITSLFPKIIQQKLLYTYTGVEPSNFNYIQKTGEIKKIGWCGGYTFKTKRYEWTQEIANQTALEYEIQSKLSYDEIKQWYNTIDVLLVNSGPEEWCETGPLHSVEGIISGTLVIGTKVGNFKNIPGPKYETVEEAVAILNDLKQNKDKVVSLMKEQYNYVINNCTYEQLIDGWDIAFKSSLALSSTI